MKIRSGGAGEHRRQKRLTQYNRQMELRRLYAMCKWSELVEGFEQTPREQRVKHVQLLKVALAMGQAGQAIGIQHVRDWHQQLFPHGGYFRTTNAYTLCHDGSPHAFYDPAKVIVSLNDLLRGLAAGEPVRVAQDHISFEDIHPFADGNGRIGRVLLVWHAAYSKLELSVPKCREAYLNAIEAHCPESLAKVFFQ